jgi:regulator of replication initiation timing
MSKVSKKSLIATAMVGALALAGSNIAAADALTDLQKAEAKIFKQSAKSQQKINSIYEQTQDLLAEYRNTVDEADVLRGYNDHVQRMVDDQKANLVSLQKQIDGIDEIKQGVVPLMYKMIDSLEKFIELDVPMNIERRQERVANLRAVMDDSNVNTSEQFRLVLEAYEIEAAYGSVFEAYQAEIDLGGRTLTADFVHMGRIAFVAQSLDAKHSWLWNNQTRAWEELGDEYIKPISSAIQMARKQIPVDLAKLPVFAAGAK